MGNLVESKCSSKALSLILRLANCKWGQMYFVCVLKVHLSVCTRETCILPLNFSNHFKPLLICKCQYVPLSFSSFIRFSRDKDCKSGTDNIYTGFYDHSRGECTLMDVGEIHLTSHVWLVGLKPKWLEFFLSFIQKVSKSQCRRFTNPPLSIVSSTSDDRWTWSLYNGCRKKRRDGIKHFTQI